MIQLVAQRISNNVSYQPSICAIRGSDNMHYVQIMPGEPLLAEYMCLTRDQDVCIHTIALFLACFYNIINTYMILYLGR